MVGRTHIFGAKEIYDYASKSFEEQSNVRQSGNIVRQFLTGTSPTEQIMENLNDTEWLASRGILNPNCDCPYKNSDPEFLEKDKAKKITPT